MQHEREIFSWEKVIDYVKDQNPKECVIRIRSNEKYSEPLTPRNLKGYANVYAKYDVESDSLFIWAYTGWMQDVHDEEDGDWGQWSMRDKIQGRRDRYGIWSERLSSSWEA